MKIRELFPDWIIKEDKNCVLLWYSTKRNGHNRKAFKFPDEIIVDSRFTEAIGLILGDGDMHRVEKCHFNYASKDADISVFILNFLRDRLLIKNEDITFTVRYRYRDPAISTLALKLNVPPAYIKPRFSMRHNYAALQMQVNGVVFRKVLEKVIATFIKSNFLKNIELRRGFLRGLFAAEGCIGIKYNEGYINQIEFALSEKETELLDMLKEALNYEEIHFKTIYYAKTHHVSIIIQNWKNYLNCWKIGLFNRCERKKVSFLGVAKTCKVYAKVDSASLNQLSIKFTQQELAYLIGSWQGNVCRILQGKILLSLRQIAILKDKDFNFSIKSLRIGNVTNLPYSEENKLLFITSS